MKKKLLIVLITLAVVLAAVIALLTVNLVRSRRAPDLESVRGRVTELVTASREVNEILFGAGLPTYPRVYQQFYERTPFVCVYNDKEYTRYYYTFEDETLGTVLAYQFCLVIREGDTYTYVDAERGGFLTVSEAGKYRYATVTGEIAAHPWESAGFTALPDYSENTAEWYYFADTDEPFYDYVRFDCGYLAVDDIKAKMETVYASAYRESLYVSLFTGITVSDRDNGTLYARYLDWEDTEGNVYLLKSNTQQGFRVDRVYDFDTMRMVKPSNSNLINIEMETYLEGDEANRVTVRLSFAFENGQWFLDSPSY